MGILLSIDIKKHHCLSLDNHISTIYNLPLAEIKYKILHNTNSGQQGFRPSLEQNLLRDLVKVLQSPVNHHAYSRHQFFTGWGK